MAKHHRDDDPKTPKGQRPSDEDALDELLAAEDTGPPTPRAHPKKPATQVGMKPPLPPQKGPPPIPKTPTTQLAPGQGGPDTPPRVPKMSLDDDEEVVDAEPAEEEEVLEAQPASDVAEAIEDADVLSAEVLLEPGSAPRRDPETPPQMEAHPVSDVFEAEALSDVHAAEDALGEADIFAEPASGAKPESDVRLEGARPKGKQDTDATEAFEGTAPRPEDLEQTAAFEASGDMDQSSAVDLGRHPKKGSSSHVGVDPVAEALESGVDLEAASSGTIKKRLPVPSVEFDDLVEPPEAKPTRKTKHVERTELDAAAMDAEEAAAADLLAEDASDQTVEDEAAALFASDDVVGDTEVPAAVEAGAEAADEDDEEAEVTPPPKRKPTTVGAGAPSRGGLGGVLVGALGGVLVAAVIGAGLWFVGLLPGSSGSAKSAPEVKAPPPPAAPSLSLAQRARADMDESNFDAALETLKDLPDDEKTPATLSARAEARWLKYQKEHADKKAPLSAADAEVKLVLADLDEAKNTLLKEQITKTLAHTQLSQQVAALTQKAKAALELHSVLAKAKIVGDKADPKELALAVSQALATKAQSDALVSGLQKALKLAPDEKLDPAAIEKVVNDAAASQAALSAVDKLLAGAQVKATGAQGVGQLLTVKQEVDKKLDAVNKLLAGANVKDEGAQGLQEILAARERLQKERDELNQAITSAYKELASAQLAPAGIDPRKGILEASKAARQRTESPLSGPLTQLGTTLGTLGLGAGKAVQGAFETAALAAEVSFYRLREPLVQGPEQRLDAYITIYQDRRHTSGAQALRDAGWVLSPAAKASPEAKAKAHLVTGLVERNQQKFGEAKKSLEAAVAALPAAKDAGPWAEAAKQTLGELSDPSAYYLPRVDEFQAAGNTKGALSEIGTALKVLPDNPRLLSQRALLQLDAVRGQGKAIPAAAQKAIRADAGAALKDPKTAPEAEYVLGVLDEELGKYDDAEKRFRAALKKHQGSELEASRYRIGLARVLLRAPAAVSAPAEPKQEEPKEEEKKKAAPKAEETSRMFPLSNVLAALALGQVEADDEDPATTARIKESVALAEELIKSKDPKVRGQGHMLLGQALARQGKRTEGLREYLRGLDLLFPGMAGKEMARMIEEHPAFQQPDATARPNAYLAELHFGKGLQAYWAKNYRDAETQFKQAAEYFGQDARYLYFLGLAQLGQQTNVKRDAAYYSFEQGARLEVANRPPPSEINASLERVQGDVRRVINHFRAKGFEAHD